MQYCIGLRIYHSQVEKSLWNWLSILFRFATGIEFREGSLLISPKCALQARKGNSHFCKFINTLCPRIDSQVLILTFPPLFRLFILLTVIPSHLYLSTIVFLPAQGTHSTGTKVALRFLRQFICLSVCSSARIKKCT